MKKIVSYAVVIFLTFLSACKGSDTYRGTWKAMDAQGAKSEINFEEKKFTVKDSTGQIKTFEYRQNSVAIANSVETFGIQLGDGRAYKICFPFADDESKGLIKDGNGAPLYTISRKEYVPYEQLYKL